MSSFSHDKNRFFRAAARRARSEVGHCVRQYKRPGARRGGQVGAQIGKILAGRASGFGARKGATRRRVQRCRATKSSGKNARDSGRKRSARRVATERQKSRRQNRSGAESSRARLRSRGEICAATKRKKSPRETRARSKSSRPPPAKVAHRKTSAPADESAVIAAPTKVATKAKATEAKSARSAVAGAREVEDAESAQNSAIKVAEVGTNRAPVAPKAKRSRVPKDLAAQYGGAPVTEDRAAPRPARSARAAQTHDARQKRGARPTSDARSRTVAALAGGQCRRGQKARKPWARLGVRVRLLRSHHQIPDAGRALSMWRDCGEGNNDGRQLSVGQDSGTE